MLLGMLSLGLAGVLQMADGQEGAGHIERWSADRAWGWYEAQPWLVGCNYVTSTAVNDIEMWRTETFDEETIARELGWAAELGLNCVRVFINCLAWEESPEGLREAFARFLDIADGHGIVVMPVLLDDCNFAGVQPKPGLQEGAVPGVHNSRWAASPAGDRAADPAQWGPIEGYVRDMVATFGNDRRILAWDLYNEPGNSGQGNASLPLLEAAFAWARGANPSQPLTVGVWTADLAEISDVCLRLSDLVTFHRYTDREGLAAAIEEFGAHGRPIICAEWMARTLGGRWETDLPLFKERGVGCMAWGLVAGETQTRFPWGSPEGGPEPDVWFHDLLHADGEPYDPDEVASIRAITLGQ